MGVEPRVAEGACRYLMSAMACSLAVTVTLNALHPFHGNSSVVFAKTGLTTTAITTLVWLAVTLLTPAEPQSTLEKFYRLVRPEVRGWKPVAARIETNSIAMKATGAPPSAAAVAAKVGVSPLYPRGFCSCF